MTRGLGLGEDLKEAERHLGLALGEDLKRQLGLALGAALPARHHRKHGHKDLQEAQEAERHLGLVLGEDLHAQRHQRGLEDQQEAEQHLGLALGEDLHAQLVGLLGLVVQSLDKKLHAQGLAAPACGQSPRAQ